ncbi:hypothetical protein [Aquabacterium sp. OR-4]|uniref:hypothetical protein n=1 Tax=Aquabacterium sp. OR-4 TaxID=2978127 RepID=UPI0021B1ED52|nr:hypothetical protein [Aquabacterium sp. OR-4]MDT7834923.1 hypothetical protein [Aquabacterium sp. OR-4]
MIEVKMGRNLTRDGVEGVRWVLVDPLESLPGERAAAGSGAAVAAAGSRPVAPAGAGTLSAEMRAALLTAPLAAPEAATIDLRGAMSRQMWMLAGLKTLVVVVALGAAMATAWQVIGPPRLAGGGSGVAPSGAATPPATPLRPVASAPTITVLHREPAR